MPKCIPRIIGNKTFPSKKSAEEFVRKFISDIGIGVKIRPTDERFYFLNELCKCHKQYNEKIQDGIEYFFVAKNRIYPKGNELRIKRINSDSIDISWVDCARNKCDKSEEMLNEAMRQAIKDFAIDYKKKNELCCKRCNIKDIDYTEFHVDHIIPFSLIKKTFLDENKYAGMIPTEFDSDKYSNIKIFQENDSEFKNSWIKYHNSFENNFQILCCECNCRKGKKVYEVELS
jgi:5-methylcytosine-specific restriction endonuclease McrA